MEFKYKEAKKKILTSFLTFSLLLSSPMGLTANESKQKKEGKNVINEVILEEGFKIELPKPHKLEKIEVYFEEHENFIARYYAHDSTYTLRKNILLYRKLRETDYFGIEFKEDSEVAAHTYLYFEKDNKKYGLLFLLLENSKIQYYLFDGDIRNTNIGRLRNKFFYVPKDVKIEVDFDIKTGDYEMRIKSEEFYTPKKIYGDVSFE